MGLVLVLRSSYELSQDIPPFSSPRTQWRLYSSKGRLKKTACFSVSLRPQWNIMCKLKRCVPNLSTRYGCVLFYAIRIDTSNAIHYLAVLVRTRGDRHAGLLPGCVWVEREDLFFRTSKWTRFGAVRRLSRCQSFTLRRRR